MGAAFGRLPSRSKEMAMEDLKAKKAFKYAGRPLAAGDTFKAPPSHAKVLVATGNAVAYVAPVIQAKPASAPAPRSGARKATNSGRQGGGYQRRDMTAAPAAVAADAPAEGGAEGADADGGAE